MRDSDIRPFGRLLAAVALANLVTAQILHEVGHWLVLSATGRNPVWGITAMVQLWDRPPLDPSRWSQLIRPTGEVGWLHLTSLPATEVEWALFVAAGPLIQLAAVAVGLALAYRARSASLRRLGLLVALVNGVTHALYQLIGSLRGGGSDETLLAEIVGLPWWIFAALFGAAAAAGAIVALAALPDRATRLRWGGALLVGALATGPLFAQLQRVIVDGVDRGGALFTPVLGLSLPVALLAIVGAVALWGVVRLRPER